MIIFPYLISLSPLWERVLGEGYLLLEPKEELPKLLGYLKFNWLKKTQLLAQSIYIIPYPNWTRKGEFTKLNTNIVCL
ncbi:MAG: hypothetical protein A2868_02725 [Candidatus Levybacteria bacterium RIFCSPHIGHO2_01_FULL_40_15b]|nr:MAG: hypothetical protein A2868_02725 [Candidatus Levybacteria bacterium RIFCSPHIGHO2_01_FULL_40_15b]